MRELLEKLKRYLDEQKNNSMLEKAEYLRKEEINQAFDNLDVDALANLIVSGKLNISEYEQSGSTFISALDGFSYKMLEDLKVPAKRDYFNYYFREYAHQEVEELPLEVQNILNQNISKLLQIMQLLYLSGANLDFTKQKDNWSVFTYFINNLEYLKSYEVFSFFFNKPEFKISLNTSINQDLLSMLIRNDSSLSTTILEQLLNLGLKVESNSSLNAYAQSVVSTDPDLINPIVECLAFSDKTKKDKLDLIYPLASPALQERYQDAYQEVVKGSRS